MSLRSRQIPKNSELARSPNVEALGRVGEDTTTTISAGPVGASAGNAMCNSAVISVANPKLQLKPGMTATVTATIAEKRDVLVVPNAALRFTPDTTLVPAVTRAAQSGKKGGTRGNGATLYKVEGAKLKPVQSRWLTS